jgi:hypothetical protein
MLLAPIIPIFNMCSFLATLRKELSVPSERLCAKVSRIGFREEFMSMTCAFSLGRL